MITGLLEKNPETPHITAQIKRLRRLPRKTRVATRHLFENVHEMKQMNSFNENGLQDNQMLKIVSAV